MVDHADLGAFPSVSHAMPSEQSIPPPPDDPVTFESPPVNEVVISVQFAAPVADDAVALGEFWPRVREAFPGLEKQPPLAQLDEDFNTPPAPAPPFQLVDPAQQRYWFVSPDETRVIQVQPDRFILNWRHRRPGDTYPRYRTLRGEFQSLFGTFRKTLPEDKSWTVSWCEISYINHIDAGTRDPARHRPLSDVLRLVKTPRSSSLLPPEDSAFQQRSLISGPDDGRPAGRLYISATPAFRTDDGSRIYALQLVARAKPAAPTLKAMFECFDKGRSLIVRSFKEITTPRMHETWGLKEGKQ